MPTLAQLQDQMQRAILDGDDAVLALIPDSPRERREVLLDVYRNGYTLRLAEVLRSEHAALHAYLGDETFDDLARAYIAAHPSRTPNARWFAAALPTFLANTEPYSDHAQIAELAAIERASADAFDAVDGPVLGLDALAAILPENWPGLVLMPQSSARLLTLSSNALAIWTALDADEEPPEPAILAAPETVVAWRSQHGTHIRAMPPEEAMMWREAVKGLTFAGLCEMVATYDDPDTAALRAATHLQGWISAGLLGGVRVTG